MTGGGALLAALAFAVAANAAASDAVERTVAARIDGDRSGVCVVALLIERRPDGRYEETRANRCASDARTLPAAAGYRFEIGSVSKALTGVLLSEMAERGELSLDDPVQRHLPTDAAMPQHDGREVTLRDLVTHTAGLPALPPGFRPAVPLNPYADLDESLVLGALKAHTLPHSPGERFAYSNWGYMLLSHALGRRAGTDYGSLLAERVLAPLGMRDTVVADNARLLPGHTSFGRATPAWDMPARFAGVGGIRSTPDDMAKLARALLGDVPAAAPATLKRALAASTQPQRKVSEQVTMATGWSLLRPPAAAGTWVFHNGMTGGFSTTLAVDRAGGRAALVFADAYGGFDDIAFRLLAPAAPLRPPARAVDLDLALARAAAGRYRLREGLDLVLGVEDGALYGQATGQGRFPLRQDSRGDYYTEVTELLLRVTRDADGRGTELSVLQGGGVLRGKRVD